MPRTRCTRRDFLRISAAGGGLLLGISLPSGCGIIAGRNRAALRPDVWVRLDPDDSITITVAKSEMGQGVRTSLAMLVAEELDADWTHVKVVQADFNERYGSQGTGGSGSVRDNYGMLRETGAALRVMLINAASARWSVPAAECSTEPSAVLHSSSGRRLRYAELAADAADQPVPTRVTLKPKSQWRILGRDQRGIDLQDVVHGRAVYGGDVRVPGLRFAVIERAPSFGSTVRSFDAAAAKAVPGVREVVEVKPVGGNVRVHAGVAVVADTTWAALEGRRALTVDWEPGPHAGESSAAYEETMRAALQRSGTELVNRVGDPDATLAAAASVHTADYDAPFLSHATMEPMTCTARVEGGRVEIWSPTQFPDWAVGATASALGISGGNVTIHIPLLGGGFGRRINPDFTVEAALVARQVSGPVQVFWTREDDLRHGFYRPCARHRLDAALGPDGFPIAWRHRMSTPAIEATFGPSEEGYGGSEGDGGGNMAYRVPNRSLEYTLLQSGVHRGWWRAVHTTHATFAVESFIDELAQAAGRDPLEYRLALIDSVPVGRPSIGSRAFPFNPERLQGVLRLAAEKAGWSSPAPAGRFRGIACGYDHLSYAAEVVEVSLRTNRVQIERVVCAADCGPVINPSGARAQVEGGIIQALSAATRERITIAGGGVEQRNFDGYPILRISEAPPVIETWFAETDTEPTGLGEPAVPPLAPALANAIARATGKRLRSLPLSLG